MSKYARVEIQKLIPYYTTAIVKVDDDDQLAAFEMYPNLFSELVIKQAIKDDNWEKDYEYAIYEEDCEISCVDEIEEDEINPYDGEIADLTEKLKEQSRKV